MSTNFESRRRVLFVDDDRHFLETIRDTLGGLSQESWEIVLAETTAQALAVLREQTIHLMVIDLRMPVLDGGQFLDLLNRRYSSIAKVILTAFPSDAARAACLASGAELFLEKPQSREQCESLYATLNELMKARPDEGFQGLLRRIGLADLLQMQCLGQSSSVVEVKSTRKRGEIYIQNGVIIHAVCGERQGQSALNRLLRLGRGEFRIKPFVEPPERTIVGAWEYVLMEAAQARDESIHRGEGDTIFVPAPSDDTSFDTGLTHPLETGPSDATTPAETEGSPPQTSPSETPADRPPKK
jgi:CheY-like chemotaxis protein